MGTIALQALPHVERLIDTFVHEGRTIPESFRVGVVVYVNGDAIIDLLDYPYVVRVEAHVAERIIQP